MSVFAFFLFAGACGAALADAGIVYSARYYDPSGRVMSHAHLYSIQPDKSGRRQLTFGNGDDLDPAVSPDGRRIAYREVNKVLVLDTRTGRTTRLPNLFTQDQKQTGDQSVDHLRWSPDSRRIVAFTTAGDTSDAVVCDGATGRVQAHWPGIWDLIASPDGKHTLALTEEASSIYPGFAGAGTPAIALPEGWNQGCWLDGRTAVLYSAQDSALEIVPLQGARRSVKLIPPAGASPDLRDRLASDETRLIGIPGDPRRVLIWMIQGNSTVGAYGDACIADTETGRMEQFCGGRKFLVPSPDGKFCVAAPTRAPAELPQRRSPGVSKGSLRPHTVWTASLQILMVPSYPGGSMKDSMPRPVQDGLVWVTGADWKKN
jgi:hypothetical protein